MRRSVLSLAAIPVLGAGEILRRRRRERQDHRVFILEYHNLGGSSSKRDGLVGVARFREHLEYLRRRFEFSSLPQATKALAHPGTLKSDTVVLTFDDGYRENFTEAWPLLAEQRVSATIFVTTGFLDGSPLWFDSAFKLLKAIRDSDQAVPKATRDQLHETVGNWPLSSDLGTEMTRLKYLPMEARNSLIDRLRDVVGEKIVESRPLSWNQVRELHDSRVDIGCHTVSHPILSTLRPEEQKEEIRNAKKRIEQETGQPPQSFAFPNGSRPDFDATTIEILRDENFRSACTTIRGSNRYGCDPLTLRRIGVGDDSKIVLAARMTGLFRKPDS